MSHGTSSGHSPILLINFPIELNKTKVRGIGGKPYKHALDALRLSLLCDSALYTRLVMSLTTLQDFCLKNSTLHHKNLMYRAFPFRLLTIYLMCANSGVEALAWHVERESWNAWEWVTRMQWQPDAPCVKGTRVFRHCWFMSFTELGKWFEKIHRFLGRIEAF